MTSLASKWDETPFHLGPRNTVCLLYGQLRGVSDASGASSGVCVEAGSHVGVWMELRGRSGAGDVWGGGDGEYFSYIYGTGELPAAIEY